MVRCVGSGLADAVADLDLGEAPELCDSACGNRWALYGGPALEDGERGDLVFETAAETQPLACVNRPGEHPDVRDLLAVRATFDLEDRPRYRAIGIACRCRQQLTDSGHQ